MIKAQNDIKDVKTRVLKVFSSELSNTPTFNIINQDIRKELKINSYKVAKIVIMLEKLYQIPISEEDTESLITINDFIEYIKDLENKKNGRIKKYIANQRLHYLFKSFV